MKPTIPPAALAQHIAIVGKTGSGKTSTGKLLVEQVVAEDSRVCVLDPIKSDWWGVIASADAKREGLPFSILGGPHGHVPLHSSAGVAIADVVARGQLPLSVLDMAEFEPGGQLKFFVDFAPRLLQRMRGVLYLVLEEAHLFAPKERSGMGSENMAIHWAKTLATAGRSKGLRLVVATQRTQALHNAVLGSCDTLIAHRLTAPADQEPVKKWLKANVEKEVFERIAGELASLKTGTAWLCSGEAKVFERIQFPRIRTFDNSATPTGDGGFEIEAAGGYVDTNALRALIGDAVKDAEANDPKKLREQIVAAEKRVRELERQVAAIAPARAPEDELVRDQQAEIARLRAENEELWRNVRIRNGELNKRADFIFEVRDALTPLQNLIARLELADGLYSKAGDPDIDALVKARYPDLNDIKSRKPAAYRPLSAENPPTVRMNGSAAPARRPSSGEGSADRRILTALAQNPEGLTYRKIGILTGVKPGGSTWRRVMARFRREGLVEESGDTMTIADAGLVELGEYEPLPAGRDLIEYWRGRAGAARAIFDAVLDGGGAPVEAARVAERVGIEHGGSTWRRHLAFLRGAELVSGSAELRPNPDLLG